MGMFDTVNFTCPKCDSIIGVQSKAGDCTLADIPSEAVPIDVAASIVGESVYCDHCDKGWIIVANQAPRVVRLALAAK